MRILIALIPLLALMAGCGADSSSDGTKNAPAKRLTDAEYESRRAKKGGAEGN